MGKSQSIQELEIQPPSASRGGPPPQYIDIDRLRNADGVVAIISQRLSTRAITFGLFKEFERDRRTERTSFFAESLRDSVTSMLEDAIRRIDEIKTDGTLMLELQREAINKMADPADQEHAARVLGLSSARRPR